MKSKFVIPIGYFLCFSPLFLFFLFNFLIFFAFFSSFYFSFFLFKFIVFIFTFVSIYYFVWHFQFNYYKFSFIENPYHDWLHHTCVFVLGKLFSSAIGSIFAFRYLALVFLKKDLFFFLILLLSFWEHCAKIVLFFSLFSKKNVFFFCLGTHHLFHYN